MSMPSKFSEEQVRACAGLTCDEMALKLGCYPPYARKLAIKYNVPIAEHARRNKKALAREDIELLLHMHIADAAKVLKCSTCKLRRYANQLGLHFTTRLAAAKSASPQTDRVPAVEFIKPPVQPPYETVGMTPDQLGVAIKVLPPVPRDEPAAVKMARLQALREAGHRKRGRPKKAKA